MNVSAAITMNYGQRTMNNDLKNKANSNPIYPGVASGEAGIYPGLAYHIRRPGLARKIIKNCYRIVLDFLPCLSRYYIAAYKRM